MLRFALTLGLILLQWTSGAAAASDLAATAATINADTARPGDTAAHVHITMIKRDSQDRDSIIATIEIDRGFHINANPASLQYLIPTTLNITNQTPIQVVYPPAIRFKPKFADEPLDVYEGTIKITAEFPRGSLTQMPYLFGTLTAQACTDEICLPPADLPLPQLTE